jgi:hypothetical protein
MKPTRISSSFTDHSPDFRKMVTQMSATERFVGSKKMVGGAPQSQRDCIHQPRVARNELPWVDCKRHSQPQRGCIFFTPTGYNPFRVDDIRFTISQGSSSLATLGYMMESLWDSPMGARQAHDLEQTIADSLPLPPGEDRGEGAQRVAEILEA